MSIVVWDGTTLAADCAMWLSNVKYKVQKIRKINTRGIFPHALVGAVGTPSFVSAGLRFIESGFLKEARPDYKEYDDIKANDVYFILITPEKKVFFFDAMFNATEVFEQRAALGAAAETAIGALDAGATAREAVEICIRRTDYAGLGVEEISF